MTRREFLLFAAILAVLLINETASVGNISRLADNARRVTAVQEVMAQLAEVLPTCQEAELDWERHMRQRTEDTLLTFRESRARLDAIVDQLTALTADNPVQQERIAFLRRQLTMPIDGTAGQREPAKTNEMRQLVVQMREEEWNQLGLRAGQTTSSARVAAYTLAGITNIIVALLTISFFLTHQARKALDERLHNRNAEAVTLQERMRHEIDVRRRLEETVLQHEERLRMVAAEARLALFALDHEGVVTLCEGKALAEPGRRAGEAIGQSTFEVFREHKLLLVLVRQALAGHEGIGVVQFGESSFAMRCIPLHGLGGRLTGVLGVACDISDRLLAEKEMRCSKEAAETAQREEHELISSLSHDVRAPINTILGMTWLLMETPLTAEQRDCLVRVRTSAESLLSAVNDMVDVSKAEGKKIELEVAPFVLREELNRLFEDMAPQADAKGLKLHWKVQPEVPDRAVGDVERLRQVIYGLVSNAIQFTRSAGVAVEMELQEQTACAFCLLVTVSDNAEVGGETAPMRESSAVKEESTAQEQGSPPSGLRIASRLVSLMGGRIWADAKVGRGNTVHFTVCLGVVGVAMDRAAPADHHTQVRAPLREVMNVHPVRMAPCRVLLVEDDVDNRLLAVRLLEKQGHTVTVAANGKEALAALKRQTFDLVVIDLQTRPMGGMEATRYLREFERGGGRHVPVIALTAQASREADERCLAAGMDSWVGKPIQPGELWRTVAEVVSGASGREEETACSDSHVHLGQRTA